MTRKKKELPIVEQIEIVDVAAEGNAIARINELVVFVPFVAPGDIVDLQIYRKKHKFAHGRVMKFHSMSPNRVEPICQHFGICGGCKWQHLPYEQQIAYKQKQVIDNLTRIGKIELPEVMPIIGSDETAHYRNKLEYTFSNRAWLTKEEMGTDAINGNRDALGFHIPGMFDKVLDIKKCWLQDDISNEIRLSVKKFALDNQYTFFDLKEQHGELRNMIVRTSTTGELMVIMVFYQSTPGRIKLMMQHIADNFPSITSLLYIINEKANDTITDQTVEVFKGNDHIFETMEELRFKIGPKSFYQTNSKQAYKLYSIAREFAALTGNELVYDLYTGTGTIANFIAHHAKQVIGIEYVPEAIDDAKINAELNKLDNTLFFAGDMKDILTQSFINEHGAPDVIITDPPRAGMHDDVIKAILFAAPKRIVYVSCNPATQARDLSLLDVDYRVEKVQPVDMFPHTHHVENVVLLTKRI